MGEHKGDAPGPLVRRQFLGALGAAGVGACGSAAPAAPANSALKPSPGARTPALRAKLASYTERGEVPGLVAGVVRDGRTHYEALGVKTVGQPGEVEPDTIFRIASMTKPVTAAATMLLVDEGKLHLDEPVDGLLPELARRKVLKRLDSPLDDVVPAERAITVRDLLTFRMGFGIVLAPPGTYPVQKAADDLALGQGMPAPAAPPAPDEWMRRFGTLPLMNQPGERWLYNTGADVLGVLVARAARQPFDAFLRERLFEPLGMNDTDFSVPASKGDRFVTSYLVEPTSGKLVQYDPVDGQWSKPPAFPSGAAGLVSTVPDFLRFSVFMLAGGMAGSKRLLSADAVKQMTTDALTPANKSFGALVPGFFDRHGWGFCMAVVNAEDELGHPPGAFGWDGGLGTSWYANPKTNSAGVLLTQRAFSDPNPPPIFHDFWQLVYAGA